VSTDEVFGSLEPNDPPFTERTPYAPNSPYAASKAASDHLVRAYHRTFGLPVTMSNCSNNYGPYQFPEKLLPLAIVNCLDGRPVPIYGDGMQVRDWLHVEDHCKGIAAVIARGRDGESYNFGGGSTVANLDLVRRLCRLIDRAFAADPTLASRYPNSPAAGGAPCESRLSFVRDRPGHDRRYAIDDARARADLGFAAEVLLDDGLAQLVAWYLANEPWWRAVQDGSYRDWIERQYGTSPSAGG
jgi:dTDP-glucose 4,6-dehydratase